MRLLAALALFVSVFVVVPVVADAAPKKPDSVIVHKEIDLTLHADKDFTKEQRAAIDRAAAEWKKFTNGRVRIVVAYDLDFDSMSNLREHKNANHSVMINIPSSAELVQATDDMIAERSGMPAGSAQVEAFTLAPPNTPHGNVVVWIVSDRITPDKYRQVVQHEMGHAIGLDDLPSIAKDIMSGADIPGTHAGEFTEADRALCRKARYCD